MLIMADGDSLRFDEVDLVALRDVLAAVGREGTPSLTMGEPSAPRTAGESRAGDSLTVEQTHRLLRGLEQISAAISAVQARALVHLEDAIAAESRQRGESARQARLIARAEASHALHQSTSAAGRSLATSRRLVRSMPRMLGALADGRLTAPAVHGVGRTMGPADPAQREEVDRILGEHLGHLEGCGTHEIIGESERILHAMDPAGAGRRHRRARQERSITVRRSEHGMCVLSARLPALDGARIRKGLSVAAESARSHGDRRGHAQIMADLFTQALLGGEALDPSTVDLGVVITDRSLLAPAHADAALIEGLGAVPYEHIRDAMYEAVCASPDADSALRLRRLYTDPEDGQLVAMDSRARAFPPGLVRYLTAAHITCRAPYCDAPIRHRDHIVPAAQGGPTSAHNGNGLCAADNQKEQAGLSVQVAADADGIRRSVEWSTRYGQRARRRGMNLDPIGTARPAPTAAASPPATSAPPAPPPPLDPLPDFHQLPTLHDALLRLHRAILGDGLPAAGDLSPAARPAPASAPPPAPPDPPDPAAER
ncbi:HNH endonuclease signature motif containing protein [Brachybacterium sp. Marseille-Q7125]|uniref:HNH endonuclease signature motif containing protein n=1 Tax=Brachybacterium sp. Marseille-Q7125 TaxID=2932815 RepID=UPI001FF2E7B2|nr:HNH endonuclease signature motif containing protein [Brachybacterium sp. Marseille-Q7125]